MKALLYLGCTLVCFMLWTSSAAAQVIYVKADATGTHDGSSWANAFTSLDEALALPNAAVIWIAAGVYQPAGTADTSAHFAISRAVALYGGFQGTETSLDERQPELFPTLISGDLLGDDVDDDFLNHKADNARHLFIVAPAISGEVRFDGLHLAYAFNRDVLVDAPPLDYQGAGIYAASPIQVHRCRFTQNRGGAGAAVYLHDAGTSGSTFTDSFFEHNLATGQSVLFTSYSNDLRVLNCRFIENQVSRGSLYPAYGRGILIEDCQFLNNLNTPNFGGAAFFWQDEDVTISRCLFRGNQAPNAAGFYLDAREIAAATDPNTFVIQNCTFEENSTTAFGGSGIYAFQASYTLRHTVFKANSALGSGAALVNGGERCTFLIDSCSFFNNTANFGGALTHYNAGSTGLVSHSLFQNNEAASSGGAAAHGFDAQISYTDCTFNENSARWGGALYSQDDSTALQLMRCAFYSNQADNFGGAVLLLGGSRSRIDQCVFETNFASFGGGLSIADGDADQASLQLTRCLFTNNLATSQGGGLNLSDVDAEITNCVFIGNVADDPGIGGGISISNSQADGTLVSITNCTLADNTGLLAGGIASWATDTISSVVRLQNTVLAHSDPNYAIAGGSPDLISGGGNFLTDLSAPSLNQASDQAGEGLDPGFSQPAELDYSPAAGSPLINAGQASGAPLDDITGAPRDNQPDIGAYERLLVATHSPRTPQRLSIAPNPAKDHTYLGLPEHWSGPLLLHIYSSDGRLCSQQTLPAPAGAAQLRVSLPPLPSGLYLLQIWHGPQSLSGTVLIQ